MDGWMGWEYRVACLMIIFLLCLSHPNLIRKGGRGMSEAAILVANGGIVDYFRFRSRFVS